MIGFVGTGRMGTAIVESLHRTLPAESIVLYDRIVERADDLARRTGAKRASNVAELVRSSTEIFLCVKPQDIAGALAEMRGTEGRLVVSIAAGVPTRYIEGKLPPGTRVVRVMPNTPCLIGAGASVVFRGSSATPADAARVVSLLSALGVCLELDEKHANAVTALSGSGPAFVYLVLEALSDGGVMAGLPRDIAQKLAAQTLIGGARMAAETGKHPGQLKDEVTSPGGTTIQGLKALEDRGVRGALIEAVRAAWQRAEEISLHFEERK